MHLVINERTKLTANWVNALSIAFAVIGGVTPVVAFINGYEGGFAIPITSGFVLWITLGWLVLAGALHFVARAVLGRLGMIDLQILALAMPAVILGLVGLVVLLTKPRSHLHPGE